MSSKAAQFGVEAAEHAVLAPPIHHGADLVAAVAVNEDETGIGEQPVQVGNAQGVDAGLVQCRARAQVLIEIA
jgi:hypothetical protein